MIFVYFDKNITLHLRWPRTGLILFPFSISFLQPLHRNDCPRHTLTRRDFAWTRQHGVILIVGSIDKRLGTISYHVTAKIGRAREDVIAPNGRTKHSDVERVYTPNEPE